MAATVNNGHLWNTGVRTGNKVVLKFGDTAIAFAQSARFQDDYGLEPVHVIGQLQTIEYVPMHARHQIQVSLLVVKGSSLSALGFEPASAGSYGVLAGNAGSQIQDGTVPMDPAFADYTAANDLIPGGKNTLAGTADDVKKTKFLRAIHQKVFDIVVYDSSVDGDGTKITSTSGQLTPLLHYRNCFFASGDVAVDANRVLMHNATFMAQDKVALNSGLFTPGFS